MVGLHSIDFQYNSIDTIKLDRICSVVAKIVLAPETLTWQEYYIMDDAELQDEQDPISQCLIHDATPEADA
ncbi:hypothetical protein FMUND_11786 [Fusarium mundagurra]|uniref:Uncharacterized protein n=1 Tax=Fusarium mundagurra TaxID=1567541 RepID=A0A8H5Y5V4_9HYPO|nr:hypothetical protein FMUND_11786 [Fusarium mundagurra]